MLNYNSVYSHKIFLCQKYGVVMQVFTDHGLQRFERNRERNKLYKTTMPQDLPHTTYASESSVDTKVPKPSVTASTIAPWRVHVIHCSKEHVVDLLRNSRPFTPP
jgi:hypothetical protein